MTKFPITRSNQPDIAPRAAAFEASAKQEEPQLESPEQGGVLKELALARWRGLLAKSEGTRRT
jgi:hypothetical protein